MNAIVNQKELSLIFVLGLVLVDKFNDSCLIYFDQIPDIGIEIQKKSQIRYISFMKATQVSLIAALACIAAIALLTTSTP